MIKVCILLVSIFSYDVVSFAQETCHDVGDQKVFIDPACSDAAAPHTGCNAGGQGQNCRFCFAVPDKCRSTPSPPPTHPTSAGTTTRFTGKTTTTTPYSPGNMSLIFEDNFDTLNFGIWKHELTLAGGGNWEFQWYVNNRSNSFVKDIVLHIRPTLTEDIMNIHDPVDFWGGQPADQCTMNQFYGCQRDPRASGNVINHVRSARLRTAETFGFQYGRIEIRARLPKGDWLWPAIWIGCCLRISAGGCNQVASTLHFGPDWAHDPWQAAHNSYTLKEGDFSQDFHTFGMLWTDSFIKTYVDVEDNTLLNLDCSSKSIWELGKFPSSFDNPWQYAGSKCAPFDKKFYLILNLAVGGTANYFPENVGGKPWTNKAKNSVNQFWNAKGQWLPTWDMKTGGSDLLVDYIRVWQ